MSKRIPKVRTPLEKGIATGRYEYPSLPSHGGAYNPKDTPMVPVKTRGEGAGKGDVPRPVNYRVYAANFDDIFRR